MQIRFCKEMREKSHGFCNKHPSLSEWQDCHRPNANTMPTSLVSFRLFTFQGGKISIQSIPHPNVSKLTSLFTTKTGHTCFALLRCCTLQVGSTPATSLHGKLLEPAWTFTPGKSVPLSWNFAKNQYFVSRWRSRRDLESYCYMLPQSQSLCSPCSLCGLQLDRALGYKGLRTLTAQQPLPN